MCIYLYDNDGSPIGMQYRTTSYAEGEFDTFWFTKNVHGDIVSVYNDAGTKLLTYHYDSWGNFFTQWHTYYGSDYYASYNPFKYRGYYHDSETGFYYLNSRYYDPATGRFLNADGLVSTGQGILGYNMYAYCNNNPVNCVDFGGKAAISISIPAAAAFCGVAFVVAVLLIYNFVNDCYPALCELARDIADGISDLLENEADNAQADSKAEEKTETETKNDKIYYGADARGIQGTSQLNIVTGPMTYEEAVVWAYATAENRTYGRDSPWGIYTENEADAIAIAGAFGAVEMKPERSGDGYMHYHLVGHNFGRYKHFHFWYGQAAGG